MAFDSLSPFGPERADILAGIGASVTANSHIPGGQFKPSDFIPKWDEQAKRGFKKLSTSEVEAKIMFAHAVLSSGPNKPKAKKK